MLYQIEQRLADLKKEIEMQKEEADTVKNMARLASADRVPGSKVVAIDVDPELYAQLQAVAKKHGVRGMRGALLLAAKAGLRNL